MHVAAAGRRMHGAECTLLSRRDGVSCTLRQRTTPAADDPKEIQMKRLFALMLIAMFSVGTLSACNTVKGAGKDVQKVGEKVEGAADDTGATDPR
jgi:predicted small secreted protein